jgi:hypothetical protein
MGLKEYLILVSKIVCPDILISQYRLSYIFYYLNDKNINKHIDDNYFKSYIKYIYKKYKLDDLWYHETLKQGYRDIDEIMEEKEYNNFKIKFKKYLVLEQL